MKRNAGRLALWVVTSAFTGALLYTLVPSVAGLIIEPSAPGVNAPILFLGRSLTMLPFGIWFALVGSLPLALILGVWVAAARGESWHERSRANIAKLTGVLAGFATVVICIIMVVNELPVWPGALVASLYVFPIIWGSLFLPRLMRPLRPGAFNATTPSN